MDSNQESIYGTIAYLRKNPGNSKALKSLKQSYEASQKKHLAIIRNNAISENIFKWESDLQSYVKLNALYDSISTCKYCTTVKPVDYESQEKVVRKLAANARNMEGDRLLASGVRADARTAFEHYTKANQISPGFGEVGERLKMSFDLASTRILIDSIVMEPNNYQISVTQLNSRVQSVVDSCQKISRFLQFFTRNNSSNFRPDQILVLKIYSYVIEKPKLATNSVAIVDTISGKMIHFLKTIASEGIMEIQIRDFNTKEIILTDRLSSEHKWVCEWWSCTGNPVGLTTEQLANCKSQEINPPDANQLFTEFSSPLYDQVTRRLKNFYSSY